MNELEKKVLDFLTSGTVFSDGAILKNLGITQSELENIYSSLTAQGYLESYADFLKKNPENSSKCSSDGCSSGGCSSGGCSSKNEDIDYSLVKVLTEKAFIF